MPGPVVNWESLSREDAIGPIVSSGRYRLDSPSTVTGSPTFAMAAAGQSATIRVFLPNGQSVETPISVSGTAAVSLVNQVGKPFSQSELALIEIEVTMPYGQNLLTTDEPNGSPSAPFATFPELNSSLPPASNKGTVHMNRLAGSGVIEMFSDGVAWAPKSCLPIVDLLDVHASVTPGNTDPNDVTLFTVPGGMWRSLDSWRFQLTYETAANTGNDGFSIRVNDVDLIATSAAPDTLTAVIAGYQRITTTLRRNYTIVGSGVSTTNPGATNVDFANDVVFVSRLTPANGANTITLRRFSMWRE